MLGLMLDLETLGLDDDAVISQIGLVAYDTKTFKVESELCVNVDVVAALFSGFTITKSTCVDFWSNQSPDVIQSVFYTQPRVYPADAASIVDEWLTSTFSGKFQIMACGLLFDVPKMNNFLTRFGFKSLSSRTGYNLHRDMRTIRDLARELHREEYSRLIESNPNPMLHNALADAHHQVEQLKRLTDILAGISKPPIEFSWAPTDAQIKNNHMKDELRVTKPTVDTKEEFFETFGTKVVQEEKVWEDPEPDDFIKHVLGKDGV